MRKIHVLCSYWPTNREGGAATKFDVSNITPSTKLGDFFKNVKELFVKSEAFQGEIKNGVLFKEDEDTSRMYLDSSGTYFKWEVKHAKVHHGADSGDLLSTLIPKGKNFDNLTFEQLSVIAGCTDPKDTCPIAADVVFDYKF